jgi:hypothetical protein
MSNVVPAAVIREAKVSEMFAHAVGWGEKVLNDSVGKSSGCGMSPDESESQPGNTSQQERHCQIAALQK